MSKTDILRRIRTMDPDGWQTRRPTDADRLHFHARVVREYGLTVWRQYLTGWDMTGWDAP